MCNTFLVMEIPSGGMLAKLTALDDKLMALNAEIDGSEMHRTILNNGMIAELTVFGGRMVSMNMTLTAMGSKISTLDRGTTQQKSQITAMTNTLNKLFLLMHTRFLMS